MSGAPKCTSKLASLPRRVSSDHKRFELHQTFILDCQNNVFDRQNDARGTYNDILIAKIVFCDLKRLLSYQKTKFCLNI